MKSQSETLYDFLTLVRYKTAKKDDIGGLRVCKEIILIQYLFSGKKRIKKERHFYFSLTQQKKKYYYNEINNRKSNNP